MLDTSNQTIEVIKCSNCWKKPEFCLCAQIQRLPNNIEVLILQHPQESRNPATTARLVSLSLTRSTHRVGLSWRSLRAALGKAALGKEASPRDWAVLYVGTSKDAAKFADKEFAVVSPRGELLPTSQVKNSLRGIVLLDGNWSQSKTLWWRNPWLLKLNRIVLNQTENSQFGKVRKQPRRGCLSTLEATSATLFQLGKDASLIPQLQNLQSKHIAVLQANR